MLRRHLFARVIVLSLLLAAPSFAGLDNSHHDIRHYLPDKDACLVCHGRKDANSYPVLEEELGAVGGECIFLCHSGKGILPETGGLIPTAGPSVGIADYATSDLPDYTTVFFTRSHGRVPENLRGESGKPVAWPPYGVNAQGVSPNARLECTSCHSVHDNRHAPFLNAPLAATIPDLNGFCDRCHPERATNNLLGPPDGTHPVDFPVSAEAAAGRNQQGRHPRRIAIQTYGGKDGSGTVNVFDVPNPSPAELSDPDLHWSMGGHLAAGPDGAMTTWNARAGSQQMGCFTCHSAHRARVNGEDNLVVVRTFDAEGGWNPLCVGCHGAARSLDADRNDWDVGMTGFGHPAGAASGRDFEGLYAASTGAFRFRVAAVKHVNPQNGNRFGDRGQIMCTTCHKVHFGMPGTMALANVGQNTKAICKACHNGVGIPNENDVSKGGTVMTGANAANSHHVTAFVVKVDGTHIPVNETGPPLELRVPSWANLATGIGDVTIGMDCADCHVFNGTAHNW